MEAGPLRPIILSLRKPPHVATSRYYPTVVSFYAFMLVVRLLLLNGPSVPLRSSRIVAFYPYCSEFVQFNSQCIQNYLGETSAPFSPRAALSLSYIFTACFETGLPHLINVRYCEVSACVPLLLGI